MTSNQTALQAIERPMQELDAAAAEGVQGGLYIKVCTYVPTIKRGWLGIPYPTLVYKCYTIWRSR